VKPIHLNLASRPYRDYLPVNLLAAAMFVLMLLLAWFNIDTAIRYRVETKTTRAKIAQLAAVMFMSVAVLFVFKRNAHHILVKLGELVMVLGDQQNRGQEFDFHMRLPRPFHFNPELLASRRITS
jgi:hypothetical protein